MIIQTLELNDLKTDKKKIVAGVFILILLAIPPTFSFQPAQADNTIRQVIKIFETYPADSASASYSIDPPLANVSKAFVFLTVSHIAENDHSDTFKLVRILDKNTLQLVGEDTATGNNAVDFIATIIEFTNDSDLEVQHLEESITNADTATEQFTIPNAINITNSFIIPRFHAMNASETSVGDEEYERIRIIDSTTWEYSVANDINTEPQTQAVTIVDWNQNDIQVVRDIGTFSDGDLTDTITPSTSIDPTRTILIVTFDTDEGDAIDSDDAGVRSSLTDSGNIILTRDDQEGNIDFSYELIEFPADFAKVTHFNTTLSDTTLEVDVTVPEIQDFSKAFAIGQSASPFGFGFGEGDECCEFSGSIDRISAILQVTSNTVVNISRDDSGGALVLGWQLIEFLEKDVPENPQGTNVIRQVVKINDEFLDGSDETFYSISPPLLNVNKTVLFVTTRDTFPEDADVSERLKRWGILNSTHFKVHGSNDSTASNLGFNFTATLVEFDSTSPINVQRDQIQYAHDITSDELVLHMSPVNTTGSSIIYNSWTSTTGDDTIGKEEMATVRIINSTTWGYKIELPSNDQESVAVVNIIDWGSDKISVQRGQDTLTGTSLSVSPITDVIRNQTILLSTFRTTNDDFEEAPDDAGLFAHLDDSTPPNIIFERVDGTDAGLLINWELISFPLKNIFIQHGIHNQTAGTTNSTTTLDRPVANVTTAFAVGTVGTPQGYASGKGSYSTDDRFGEITGTMTLDDSTTVRLVRGLSAGSWDVGFQVIEFQDNFCEVCLETTSITLEPSAPVDVTVLHQLLEWFEPENAPLEAVISDLEVAGLKLFEVLLKMHNATYGVDANLTSSAEFYEEQYLNETYTKIEDFTGNITTAVRTNFGAPP